MSTLKNTERQIDTDAGSALKKITDMIGTVVPPNTAVLGTGKKPAVFRNGGIGT